MKGVSLNAAHDQRAVNRAVAWLVIVFTIFAVIVAGLWIGEQFFWGKYTHLSKEQYDYQIALNVVKSKPDDPTARLNLGRALLELGSYDKAITEFERSLQLEPENLSAQYLIAVTQIRQGKLAEGEGKLTEVIQKDPKYIEARHDLAIVEMNLGKYDEAIRQYLVVDAARPGDADVIYQIGIAYQKKGDKDKAREFYTRALQYYPNFSDAKEALKALN